MATSTPFDKSAPSASAPASSIDSWLRPVAAPEEWVGGEAALVGCTRSVEKFLPWSLGTVGWIERAFDVCRSVLVENDSTDATKAMVRQWQASCPERRRVLEMDGLASQIPERTERLAVTRGAGMNAALEGWNPRLVVVIDMDEINAQPPEGFARACQWLLEHPEASTASANQRHLYYDIWTLREASWCPGDCWAEVARAGGTQQAVQQYVGSRQVHIAPDREPIEVESAFGGLAIYRADHARLSRYHARNPDGTVACEHVAFTRGLPGRRFILPFFRTTGPP